jgi:putative Ca2+/H+ antiporter (TMEM165/GDT1 family)
VQFPSQLNACIIQILNVILFVAFGELVLQERKETREMKQRLMTIEEQLQSFQNQDCDEVSGLRTLSIFNPWFQNVFRENLI